MLESITVMASNKTVAMTGLTASSPRRMDARMPLPHRQIT
jgi:hypothetical protein